MDGNDISKGIFARGWADTKCAMRTVWFWVLDAGGGAVMGVFDPIWGVVWFFGGFAMLWLGAIAGAPLKQRKEARQALLEIAGNGSIWVGLEAGGRHYRDLMSQMGMKEGVQEFDSMSSLHPEQPTNNPVAGAFRWVVEVAINDGFLEVWGVPENGSVREKITHVEDNMEAYRKSREGDSMFLMMDGVYYRDLQIKKSTIKSYAEHVRSHDAELKRSAEARKAKRVHQGT